MDYQELKNNIYQEKLTELSNEVGLFWAFNDKQFKEGIKKYPAKKYASIGMGGFVPKENVDKFLQGMKELSKWFKKEVKNIKDKEKAILYELNNYECFYTNDIEPVIEVLEGLYTKQEIIEVYKNKTKRTPFIGR